MRNINTKEETFSLEYTFVDIEFHIIWNVKLKKSTKNFFPNHESDGLYKTTHKLKYGIFEV